MLISLNTGFTLFILNLRSNDIRNNIFAQQAKKTNQMSILRAREHGSLFLIPKMRQLQFYFRIHIRTIFKVTGEKVL
jgi:hypothetical protein